jgi:hypothetical protein
MIQDHLAEGAGARSYIQPAPPLRDSQPMDKLLGYQPAPAADIRLIGISACPGIFWWVLHTHKVSLLVLIKDLIMPTTG